MLEPDPVSRRMTTSHQSQPDAPGMAFVRAASVTRDFQSGRQGAMRALDAVELEIAKGEVLGLVGESGSGKTTLGRILSGLDAPTSGQVEFDGGQIETGSSRAFRDQRQRVQYVYQDPLSALNPRLTIGFQVAEGLRAHFDLDRSQAQARALAFLTEVGLSAAHAASHVHQLSGGQRQRAVIARALALQPDFVVFDEPVSALDLSVQAQVLDVIVALQRRQRLTALFISHDLRVVRYVADRIAVLHQGRLVEIGPADAVYHSPQHAYTKRLLAAVPRIDPTKGPGGAPRDKAVQQ